MKDKLAPGCVFDAINYSFRYYNEMKKFDNLENRDIKDEDIVDTAEKFLEIYMKYSAGVYVSSEKQ